MLGEQSHYPDLKPLKRKYNMTDSDPELCGPEAKSSTSGEVNGGLYPLVEVANPHYGATTAAGVTDRRETARLQTQQPLNQSACCLYESLRILW